MLKIYYYCLVKYGDCGRSFIKNLNKRHEHLSAVPNFKSTQ